MLNFRIQVSYITVSLNCCTPMYTLASLISTTSNRMGRNFMTSVEHIRILWTAVSEMGMSHDLFKLRSVVNRSETPV